MVKVAATRIEPESVGLAVLESRTLLERLLGVAGLKEYASPSLSISESEIGQPSE